MYCILTGFDPFDTAEVNPSQQAVEKVDGTLQVAESELSLTVKKLILPTCCGEAWATLQRNVESLGAESRFVLVMSGLAQKREKITLERYALNVRDYRVADNRGHQYGEERLDDAGPHALCTDVPLAELAKALNDSGLRTETSYHAGTFVCNETYYRALRKWSADPRCAGILFVHFPSPENYAKVLTGAENAEPVEKDSTDEQKADAIKEFARALSETLVFMCNLARQGTVGASAGG